MQAPNPAVKRDCGSGVAIFLCGVLTCGTAHAHNPGALVPIILGAGLAQLLTLGLQLAALLLGEKRSTPPSGLWPSFYVSSVAWLLTAPLLFAFSFSALAEFDWRLSVPLSLAVAQSFVLYTSWRLARLGNAGTLLSVKKPLLISLASVLYFVVSILV